MAVVGSVASFKLSQATARNVFCVIEMALL
jgi:hypothetical protein